MTRLAAWVAVLVLAVTPVTAVNGDLIGPPAHEEVVWVQEQELSKQVRPVYLPVDLLMKWGIEQYSNVPTPAIEVKVFEEMENWLLFILERNGPTNARAGADASLFGASRLNVFFGPHPAAQDYETVLHEAMHYVAYHLTQDPGYVTSDYVAESLAVTMSCGTPKFATWVAETIDQDKGDAVAHQCRERYGVRW